MHINEAVNGYYRTTSIGGIHNSYGWYIDNAARLWTIQQAKDGDVLAYRGEQWIFIYKERKDETLIEYYALASEKGLTINDVALTVLLSCIVPATKEQRDALMKAMSDAGYTFDFEKKELKKINNRPLLSDFFKAEYERGKADAQKSSWSEEDEKHYQGCLNLMKLSLDTKPYPYYNDYLWLKSLKDRVQLQNTVTDEELAQAKKDTYNDALDKIEYHSGEPTFDDGWDAAIWYLKKKNAQPQSQWKPSESDILLLERITNGKSDPQNFQASLCCLIERLKKLREE